MNFFINIKMVFFENTAIIQKKQRKEIISSSLFLDFLFVFVHLQGHFHSPQINFNKSTYLPIDRKADSGYLLVCSMFSFDYSIPDEAWLKIWNSFKNCASNINSEDFKNFRYGSMEKRSSYEKFHVPVVSPLATEFVIE